MFQELLQQRRRLGLAVVLTQVAVWVLWPHVLVAALVAVMTPLLAAAILIGLPQHRHWIDITALSMALAAWLPEPLILPACGLIACGIHLLIRTPLLDSLPLRFAVDCHRDAYCDRPIAACWNGIVPGAGHPDDHWSGRLIDYDRDAEDAETVYLRFRSDGPLAEEVTVAFLERAAPYRARYLYEQGEGSDITVSLVTLDLAPVSDTATEIRSEIQLEDLPLRAALSHWLDDSYGDDTGPFAQTLQTRCHWTVTIMGHQFPAAQGAAGPRSRRPLDLPQP